MYNIYDYKCKYSHDCNIVVLYMLDCASMIASASCASLLVKTLIESCLMTVLVGLGSYPVTGQPN